ncbi:hypothetical protein D0Z03_002613 [Geotrichum reessii]|nr:hypothetical protein D0Z03_002613 [Galactomyces reessii]
MLLRPSTQKRIFLSGTTSNSNTKLTNSTATPYSFSLKHQHYLSTSSIASAPFATSNSTNNTSSGGGIPRPDLRKTNTFTTTKLVTDELNYNSNGTSTGGISVSDDRQARKSIRPYTPFGSYWHAKARLIKPLEPSVSAKSDASTNPQQQQRERFTPTHTPTSSITSVQSASPTQFSSPASSVSSSKRQHHRHVQQPGPDIQYVLTELARREQIILDLRLEVAALEADLNTFKSQVFPAAAPAPPSPAPSETSIASTPSSTTSTIVGSEVSGSSTNADVTSNVYKTLANNVSMLNVGIGLWAIGFGLGKQFVFGY